MFVHLHLEVCGSCRDALGRDSAMEKEIAREYQTVPYGGEGKRVCFNEKKMEKKKAKREDLRNFLCVVGGFAAFIAVCGIAGSYDMAEAVVSGMSAEKYEAVRQAAGTGDIRAVAEEYMENKEYYDAQW